MSLGLCTRALLKISIRLATSITLRIEYWRKKAQPQVTGEYHYDAENLQPKSLMPFFGNPRQPMPPGLAFNLLEKIELLDWTGRIIRDDKKGAISKDAPLALQRLDIAPEL